MSTEKQLGDGVVSCECSRARGSQLKTPNSSSQLSFDEDRPLLHRRPGRTSTAFTIPADEARSSFSIFIASITTRPARPHLVARLDVDPDHQAGHRRHERRRAGARRRLPRPCPGSRASLVERLDLVVGGHRVQREYCPAPRPRRTANAVHRSHVVTRRTGVPSHLVEARLEQLAVDSSPSGPRGPPRHAGRSPRRCTSRLLRDELAHRLRRARSAETCRTLAADATR